MPDCKRLWKSYCTLVEMLSDRGYKLDESNEPMIEEDFDYPKEEDEDDTFRVLFCKESSDTVIKVIWLADANINNIQAVSNEMEEEGLNRVIIVVDGTVTSFANDAIKDLNRQKRAIEVFTLTETQYNPSKNILVPKHTICPKSELDEILTQYAITANQLLHIKKNDVMARYLGAAPGQVLKIESESFVMPGTKTISYSFVVS